jgi:hypothetical protein
VQLTGLDIEHLCYRGLLYHRFPRSTTQIRELTALILSQRMIGIGSRFVMGARPRDDPWLPLLVAVTGERVYNVGYRVRPLADDAAQTGAERGDSGAA